MSSDHETDSEVSYQTDDDSDINFIPWYIMEGPSVKIPAQAIKAKATWAHLRQTSLWPTKSGWKTTTGKKKSV